MHKFALFFTALILFCTLNANAQTPQQYNYQGIVRDAGGNLIANPQVGIRMSIHQTSPGGTIVYQETHLPTTNQFGLINLQIGLGTVITGDFTTIAWDKDSFYQQTELDPNGSTGGLTYTDMGTTQLISVPYALHSENTRLVRVGGTNIAVGDTGYDLSAVSNTAMGQSALNDNTTGLGNTAYGAFALYKNTDGFQNTAIGVNALKDNTSGVNNTALGEDALNKNKTGNANTTAGAFSLYQNTTGFNNSALGTNALFENTIGNNNTATGAFSLTLNIDGDENTASGIDALHDNTSGSYNTATGGRHLGATQPPTKILLMGTLLCLATLPELIMRHLGSMHFMRILQPTKIALLGILPEIFPQALPTAP